MQSGMTPEGQPSLSKDTPNGHFLGHNVLCIPMAKDTNSYLLLHKFLPERRTRLSGLNLQALSRHAIQKAHQDLSQKVKWGLNHIIMYTTKIFILGLEVLRETLLASK